MKSVDSLQDVKAEPTAKAAPKAKLKVNKETTKKGSGTELLYLYYDIIYWQIFCHETGGFGAPVQLSDKLAALLGESVMPRTEVRHPPQVFFKDIVI